MPNPLPPEFPFDAEGGQGPSAEPVAPVAFNLPPGSVLPAGLNGPIVITIAKSLRDLMETARKTGRDETMDVVRAVQANNAAARRQTQPEWEILPEMLSATDLARHLKADPKRVETILRRYRKKHVDCFREAEGAKRNEARFLYRVKDVITPLKQALAKG
jgi:hypothetical protein